MFQGRQTSGHPLDGHRPWVIRRESATRSPLPELLREVTEGSENPSLHRVFCKISICGVGPGEKGQVSPTPLWKLSPESSAQTIKPGTGTPGTLDVPLRHTSGSPQQRPTVPVNTHPATQTVGQPQAWAPSAGPLPASPGWCFEGSVTRETAVLILLEHAEVWVGYRAGCECVCPVFVCVRG